MRAAALLIVLLAASAGVAQAGLAHWMEAKICQMVVGHLESDFNDWACDEITAEVTGVAASMLAETSLFEAVEDPIIAAVTKHICDRAADYLEEHFGVGPSEVCADLGLSMRRRRDLDSDPTATSSTTAAAAPAVTTSSSSSTTSSTTSSTPSQAVLTEAAFKKITAHRMHVLHQKGTPAAVFADGSIGYCFPDEDTGVYSCMEPGLSSKLAASNPSASLVSPSGSHGTGLSTGAVIAVSMLSTFFVLAVAVVGALVIKLRTKSKAAAASSTDYASGSMGELLLPSSM